MEVPTCVLRAMPCTALVLLQLCPARDVLPQSRAGPLAHRSYFLSCKYQLRLSLCIQALHTVASVRSKFSKCDARTVCFFFSLNLSFTALFSCYKGILSFLPPQSTKEMTD